MTPLGSFQVKEEDNELSSVIIFWLPLLPRKCFNENNLQKYWSKYLDIDLALCLYEYILGWVRYIQSVLAATVLKCKNAQSRNVSLKM